MMDKYAPQKRYERKRREDITKVTIRLYKKREEKPDDNDILSFFESYTGSKEEFIKFWIRFGMRSMTDKAFWKKIEDLYEETRKKHVTHLSHKRKSTDLSNNSKKRIKSHKQGKIAP